MSDPAPLVSISALEGARTGMSEPEHWSHSDDAPRWIGICGNDSIFVDNSCDARGLVATIKAAPALIALAKALLAWNATCRELERIDPDGKLEPMSPLAVELGGRMIEDWRVVEAALAAVAP